MSAEIVSTPGRRGRARLAVLGVVVLVAVAGTALLVGLNPTAPSTAVLGSIEGDPQELLGDPGLTLASGAGPWVAEQPGGLVVRGGSATRLRGTVRQEVPLTALPGRPYRFTVRLRTAGPADGVAAGAVQVQTACSGTGEVARTAFAAGSAWQEVSATLTAVRPEGCSLRVLIEAGAEPGIEVAATALRVGLLVDPSFEAVTVDASGALSGPWQAEGLTASVVSAAAGSGPDARPVDGGQSLRVLAGPSGGSLRQTVRLDPSSEPVLARAELSVRAAAGSPSSVRLRVGRACPTTPSGGDAVAPAASARVVLPAAGGWERVAVQQSASRAADGFLADPPSVIRPDGVGCTVTLEVVLPAGAAVLLDGADLRLTSLFPPSGSDRYRREVAEPVTGPTTPIDQRMGGSVDGAASVGGS